MEAESSLRMRAVNGSGGASTLKRNQLSHADTESECHDDPVDYSNALIYFAGIQVVTGTVVSSLVSILGCSLVPQSIVSAVRTLTLATASAVIFVYKPLRIGHVRGLEIVFSALRPCVFIYIASLTLEQLVHTCARDSVAPSWRRVLVHAGSFIQLFAGFLRARNPVAETDLPFILVIGSLLLVAMLPPPAVILQGPLCSSPSIWTAAERMLRSFCFSITFAVFVFCSSLPSRSTNELLVCVARAASASVWVLMCHSYMLIFVIPQCVMAVYSRVRSLQPGGGYQSISQDDPESGTMLLKRNVEAAGSGSLAKNPTDTRGIKPAEDSGLRLKMGSDGVESTEVGSSDTEASQNGLVQMSASEAEERLKIVQSLHRDAERLRMTSGPTGQPGGHNLSLSNETPSLSLSIPETTMQAHGSHASGGMIKVVDTKHIGPLGLKDISGDPDGGGGVSRTGEFSKDEMARIANEM